MLDRLVALIFSYVLIISGASVQHELFTGVANGDFQVAYISSEKNDHHSSPNTLHSTDQHVEVNEEEEEDNEEKNEWDDKISNERYRRHNSLFGLGFLISWFSTDLVIQRLQDVWRPPQNS